MASSVSAIAICVAFLAVCSQQVVFGRIIHHQYLRYGSNSNTQATASPTPAPAPPGTTTANVGGYTMAPGPLPTTSPPPNTPGMFNDPLTGISCSTASNSQCTNVNTGYNQNSYVCPTNQLFNNKRVYYVQTITPTYSQHCVAV